MPFAPAIEYYSLLVIAAGVILAIHLILRSRIGLAFAAIRENELEARASGIDPVKYKLLAFTISAYFAGLAGALEIAHFGYITPEIFGVDISFWPIIYSISGGLGTIAGPIIGTIIISLFWDGLRMAGLTYVRFIIIGLILILVVIFLPHGIISLPDKIREWRNARKRGRSPDQPPDQPTVE
jgi:branched-chain amino acid transport system permease protein